jgi:hypothetical protein
VRAIIWAGRGLPALPAPRALRGVVEAVVSNRLSRTDFVGRLRQTPGRFTERRRGDASDLDGQAGGRASGSERVKRPAIYFSLTALCDR